VPPPRVSSLACGFALLGPRFGLRAQREKPNLPIPWYTLQKVKLRRNARLSCRGSRKDVEARKTRIAAPDSFSRWLAVDSPQTGRRDGVGAISIKLHPETRV